MDQTQQNSGSLSVLWTRCRWVGIINTIFHSIYLFIFLSVIVFVMTGQIKLTEIIIKHSPSHKAHNLIDQVLIIWSVIIFYALTFYTLLEINYELTSRNIPTDGKKTMIWMKCHGIIFFGLILTEITYFGSMRSTYDHSIVIANILLILVMFIIVVMFHKEITTSADGRNP